MKTIEISDDTMRLLKRLVKEENRFLSKTEGAALFTPETFLEQLVYSYKESLKN